MSTPDRHEHLGALLIAALEQAPEERDRFLDRACHGDARLRGEIDTLLKSHDAAGSFLEVPALRSLLPSEGPMEGRVVGPYRLLREIGRGGMGVVYIAVRSDKTFEKTVAVKLIKRGMDTEEIVRRFEKERQILAGLDHPNIARILDGGSTDDGLPYLVMEHVAGLPILEFCDSRALPTSERLRLFCSVCSAVAFAHQQLVVHRDLKPSNILVDATGRPRLLDFGIAKILASEEAVTRTITRLRPMTPLYSSPEQIRGEAISTTSDVYSLGVLLYEILTGRSPYRIASGSPNDIERAVSEQDPERPSVVVGRREEMLTSDGRAVLMDPGSISAARDGDVRKLRRRLAGDIDTIVLRALQKDPRRRYGSAEQLSEDIRRHLSGLPIRARKDTLIYRGGKFIRRHAFGVAAAAAFSLLVLGTTVALALQTQRIESERLKADQISAFLTGLFKGSDPREARGASLTVREMLDRGAARISHELAAQPGVQATLMDTIGSVYEELGLYAPAKNMFQTAYETRRRFFGENSLEVSESLFNLGNLGMETGSYAQAENRLRLSLALRRQMLGQKNVPVAETLQALARLLHRKGNDQESESVCRSALSIRRELLGEKDPLVASSWNTLGATLVSLGKYDDAERALRKALEIARQSSDPDDPSIASYRNDLGIGLMANGEFHEAAVLYRESADARRRLVGDEHPSIAPLLANLAAALDEDGKTEEAEPLSRKALAITRRTLGEQHPNMAFAWQNLATILRSKGDRAGVQQAAGEALRIFRANLPDRHLNLSGPLVNLGWALDASTQPAAAEPLLREAVDIRRRILRDGDWRLAEAESQLGTCLSLQGRYDEASALLAKSYAALKTRLGLQNRQTVATLQQLATLYDNWHKPERARLYHAELALLPKPQ